MGNISVRHFRSRAAATMGACLVYLFTSIATHAAPVCAPSQLVVLDAASISALTQITEDPNNAAFVLLGFDSQTPQLLSLQFNDIILLTPTPQFPTGLQGTVSSVNSTGSGIDISVTSSRTPLLAIPLAGTLESTALPGASNRACAAVGIATDDNNDGFNDSGRVDETCSGTNGAEHGFRLQVADGVEINGLVSVTPFDFDGSFELDLLQVAFAHVISQGRASFTGEISATADAVLPDTPFLLGTFPIGSYQLQVGDVGSLTANIFADLFVGACGSISAGARAGLSSTAITTLGIDITAGQLPKVIADAAETDLRISPPQLDNDAGMDVTLYGGAVLRMNVQFDVGNVFPFGGVDLEMTARGSVRNQVDPASDPWWQISGQPEVYVDISPQLLTADLSQFNFQVVNPAAQTFFTSNDEFLFDPPAAAAQRGDTREAGSALRWSRAHLSEDAYTTSDTAPTADGGVLLVGKTPQFGTVLRVDYLGNRVWQRRVEGAFVPQSIHELSDGSVLVAGIRNSSLWLMRLDASGNLVWSRDFLPVDGDIVTVRIAGTAGNEVVLGGMFNDTSGPADRGPWAARISEDGDVTWAWRYGQDNLDEEMLGVSVAADGGLVLVGETDFSPPGPLLAGSNAYTLRVTADGDVLWSNVWASSTIDRLYTAVQDPDGGFVVAGRTGGTNLDAAPRGLVIRYGDDSLTPPSASRWVRAFGASFNVVDTVYDEIVAVTATDHGFTFAGRSLLGSDMKGWLFSIAERGGEPDLIWSTFHDGLDSDVPVTLHDLGDGLLVGGHSLSFADGALDNALWLSRFPYEGYLAWNGDAQANTQYTPLIEDAPVGYPLFADDLNITGEQDTTALEQQIPITFTVSDSTLLTLIPTGFAQVELVRGALGFADSDGDGIGDDIDNCTLDANADQRDTNDDGYGNLCDPDLDNNGVVNFIDLSLLSTVFFGSGDDEDLNGDGVVNFLDLSIMSQRFFAAPGPSGIAP